MPSLNPVTQTVLIIIAVFILIAADLIVNNMALSEAKQNSDKDNSSRLKSMLSEKLSFTFIGISLVLIYYVINFVIFLLGHFYRN